MVNYEQNFREFSIEMFDFEYPGSKAPFPYLRILCTIHVRTPKHTPIRHFRPILVISILRGRLTKCRALHVVSCHVRFSIPPTQARKSGRVPPLDKTSQKNA